MLNCADDKPWSDKQASVDDGALSNDEDEDDEDEDDEDDDDSHADYDQRRDETDNSDAFDYVRVQLPLGGHGDNIAKSQLSVNQVRL